MTPINAIPAQMPSGVGVVYIVDVGTTQIKIGITCQPRKRLQTLQSSSGMEIHRYFITEPIPNYRIIEKALHQQFNRQRVRGEWFKVNYEDACNFLKSLRIKTFTEKETMAAMLGQKIKKFREAQKISQQELAKKLNYLNQSQVSKIEKGDRKVTALDLAEISKALGVAVNDLING